MKRMNIKRLAAALLALVIAFTSVPYEGYRVYAEPSGEEEIAEHDHSEYVEGCPDCEGHDHESDVEGSETAPNPVIEGTIDETMTVSSVALNSSPDPEKVKIGIRLNGGHFYDSMSTVFRPLDEQAQVDDYGFITDKSSDKLLKTALYEKYDLEFADNSQSDKYIAPYRTGYIFKGWEDQNGTPIFWNERVIDSDITICAIWEAVNAVEDPVISAGPASEELESGVFSEKATMGISTATEDARVFYKTSADGEYIQYTDRFRLSDVPTADITYIEDANNIKIKAQVTVYAYAAKENYDDSEEVSKTITFKLDSADWGEVIEKDRALYASPAEVPSGLWIAGIKDIGYDYLGSARTFVFGTGDVEVRVYSGKKLLKLGTDFTVSYKNNVNAYELETGDDGYNAAKAPAVIVTCKGNYAGTLSKTFKINRIDITKATIANPTVNLRTNNAVQKPGNTITYSYELNEKKVTLNLKSGTDYTLTYPKTNSKEADYDADAFKKAGEYDVTVTAKGNYKGETSYKVVIKEANATVLMSSLTYTIGNNKYNGGAEVLPSSIVIKNGKTVLNNLSWDAVAASGLKVDNADAVEAAFAADKTLDYVFYVSNNTAVGTAAITFVGNATRSAADPEYTGKDYIGTVTRTYQITGNTFNANTITFKEKSSGKYYTLAQYPFLTFSYNGQVQKQKDEDLELIFNRTKNNPGTALENGKDYTVTYSAEEPVSVGTYTVTYTGINGYVGTVSRSYKIIPCNIANIPYKDKLAVSLKDELSGEDNITYKKGGAKPVPTVTLDGKELVPGTDYTVTYKNNAKVYALTSTDKGFKASAAPTIVITGKGNYAGTANCYFTIAQRELAADQTEIRLTAADRVYANKAGNFTTSVTVKDAEGKALAAGTDYCAYNDKNNPFRYYYTVDTDLADGTSRMAGDLVASSDKVPAGTILKVVVTLKGNYIGTVEDTFRIYDQDISKATVRISTQYYTGKEVCPGKQDIVVILNGKVLADQDYEITGYANNINKGTAKVTLQGVEQYGGTKTVNFTIAVMPVAGKDLIIIFNGNGATSGSMGNQKMAFNATRQYTLNANTYKRTGYVFTGWNTAPDGSGKSYSEYVGSKDPLYKNMADHKTIIVNDADINPDKDLAGQTLMLYAQWVPVRYYVTFHTNGGVNNNYNFASAIGPDADQSSHGKGALSYDDKGYFYESGYRDIKIYSPLREDWPTGYQFGGWYKEKNYKTKISEIRTGSTGDIHLYAKWIPYTYDVVFDGNGAASGAMNNETFSYGVAKKLLKNSFKRTGYVFMGWSKDPNAAAPEYKDTESVTDITDPVNNILTKVTLYAIWDNEFAITYILNGGSLTGEYPRTHLYNVKATTLPAPVREGYIFSGWYKDENFKTRVTSIAKGEYGDKTFYAKWTPYSYKIAYNGNGDKESPINGKMGTSAGTYNTKPVTLSNNTYTRKGYRFKEWNTIPNPTAVDPGHPYAQGESVDFLPAANNVTINLYAIWEATPAYTLTLEANGGECVRTFNFASGYGLAEAVMPKPVREGYIFAGWYKDPAFKTKVTSIAKTVYTDMTLYAKWIPYSYTVKYIVNAENSKEYPVAGRMNNLSGKYGTPVTLAANGYTWKGHRFIGWAETENPGVNDTIYTNGVNVDFKPAGDGEVINLYAQWAETDDYRVVFEENGGSEITDQNPAQNTTLVLIDESVKNKPYKAEYVPQKTGYTFAGWYAEPNFRTKVTKVSYANKDVTLYAKWNAGKYTVTYSATAPNGSKVGGKKMAAQALNYGATKALTKNTYAVSGYLFVDWTADDGNRYDNGQQVTDIDEDHDGKVDLTANWDIIDYSIVYNNMAGIDTNNNPATYTVNDEIILSEPYSLGDTFLGWYSDARMTKKVVSIPKGSTGNKTFYAKWAKTQYTINYNLNLGKDKNAEVYLDTSKAGYVTSYDGRTENGYILATPVRDGYVFKGWYKEAACRTAVGPIVASPYVDMTVYAKWAVHEHDWDEGVKISDADCLHSERIRYTCKTCGEKKVEEKDKAAGHNYILTFDHENNIKKYECSVCGASLVESYVPESNCTAGHHVYVENVVDSTCTKEGYRQEICKLCGDQKEPVTIARKEHTWDEGVVLKEAKCGVAGEKKCTCTGCGATKTEEIPMLIHDYVLIGTTPATCASTGEHTYKCSRCNDIVRETINVNNNHDWSGSYVTETAPTCKQKGLDVLYCARCNKKIDEIVTNEVPHNYEWVVTEATTEADGLKEYKCKWCGHVSQSEVIPKLTPCAHSSKRTVQISAGTCQDREVVDIYCNDCGELLNSHVLKYKDPDNHVEFEETIETPATYDAAGVKKYTCKGCGYSYTETIPKLVCLHPKTCVKNVNGRSYKECEICGKDLGDVSIVINCSHSGYARTEVVVQQATSTDWGEYNYVCSHCGKVLDTKRVHPYDEYHLTDQYGKEVTVYGWFDHELSQEIFNMINEYRNNPQSGYGYDPSQLKDIGSLHYNTTCQEASDTRALEAAVYFSHSKPNGQKWNTTCSQWQYGGENIASGQTSTQSVMEAWKKSQGHNLNLLYGSGLDLLKDKNGAVIYDANGKGTYVYGKDQRSFEGVSVGVFHRYVFTNSSRPSIPNEIITWGQQFTFYEY